MIRRIIHNTNTITETNRLQGLQAGTTAKRQIYWRNGEDKNGRNKCARSLFDGRFTTCRARTTVA